MEKKEGKGSEEKGKAKEVLLLITARRHSHFFGVESWKGPSR